MNDAKYIGMDVHQATISVAVRDSDGKLVMEAILETKAETILQFVGGLRGSLHVTANIYLHYVFDLWVDVWRTKCAQGDVDVVRYADDIVLGFQHQAEADRFLEKFREQLGKFGLELHPDKTHRIEFGRYAEQNRGQRGGRKTRDVRLSGIHAHKREERERVLYGETQDDPQAYEGQTAFYSVRSLFVST
jgi:hypothetical protein